LKYSDHLPIIQELLNNKNVPKPATSSHPGSRLNLTDVFDALRDPIRREIVRRLSREESLCASFADLGSASGLSYHFTRLRTAGLTNTRKSGTCRLISLRKEAIESQLPGLLACVLKETKVAA
jgi:DNA-binding transcriptional ArsR family regulator